MPTVLATRANLAASAEPSQCRLSAAAFTLLRLAGAAYLVYLGLQTLWLSRRRSRLDDVTMIRALDALLRRPAFARGW
jgi:threonine/homoserine/homoserine lactone efflux protein